MIDKIVNKSADSNPDVIILNGDFVAHGHTAEANDSATTIEVKWASAKAIMGFVF
jgi:predicted phosphodiesterase